MSHPDSLQHSASLVSRTKGTLEQIEHRKKRVHHSRPLIRALRMLRILRLAAVRSPLVSVIIGRVLRVP